MTVPPAGLRELTFAGGVFEKLHRRVIGPPIDLSELRLEGVPVHLLTMARAVWRERVFSEFRSIQIMIRFLTEIVGAGEPLDVYAGAVELVEDEIRHTELCAAICAKLDSPAGLPDPVALQDPPKFLSAPMSERALATAITMLGINETISAGYIADLAARCRNVAIKQVLDATIDDEDDHQEFGWSYIRRSLPRFPAAALADWQHLVRVTLEPHDMFANQTLLRISVERRQLAAWPEAELAELGLFSPERQALVFQKTRTEILEPRLAALGLLPR